MGSDDWQATWVCFSLHGQQALAAFAKWPSVVVSLVEGMTSLAAPRASVCRKVMAGVVSCPQLTVYTCQCCCRPFSRPTPLHYSCHYTARRLTSLLHSHEMETPTTTYYVFAWLGSCLLSCDTVCPPPPCVPTTALSVHTIALSHS